eukprot:scpid31028/ scgid7371/ 
MVITLCNESNCFLTSSSLLQFFSSSSSATIAGIGLEFILINMRSRTPLPQSPVSSRRQYVLGVLKLSLPILQQTAALWVPTATVLTNNTPQNCSSVLANDKIKIRAGTGKVTRNSTTVHKTQHHNNSL